MEVYELLKLIPVEKLKQIGAETKVDKINTYRFKGIDVFQLLLYSIIENDSASLRNVENSLLRKNFTILYDNKPLNGSRSGLSDRLKVIPYQFFEEIFNFLSSNILSMLPKKYKHAPIKFDSTIITLSSKLLKAGYPVSKGPKSQIKCSIGFKGIPTECKIWHEKSSMSEEVALRDLIFSSSLSKDDIIVFDRGLKSRKSLKSMTKKGISFITRADENINYRIVRENSDVSHLETDSLKLAEDKIVNLRSKDVHWVDEEFRLITAKHKKTNQTYCFLSNITSIPANEITDIYKSRWEIETFFKFIKQYLSGDHFISRSLNGIKSFFYMVLIASELILAYKILNDIESLRLSFLNFREELRNFTYYQIVLFYQKYPDKFSQDFKNFKGCKLKTRGIL